jgi:hypothetical protein
MFYKSPDSRFRGNDNIWSHDSRFLQRAGKLRMNANISGYQPERVNSFSPLSKFKYLVFL